MNRASSSLTSGTSRPPAAALGRFPACRWLFPLAAGLLHLAGGALQAEPGPPAETAPVQRELWVPEKHLAEVLATHPKAVVLDRRQYEALIRDAGEARVRGKIPPPVKAVIGSASFTGRLAGQAVVADAVLEIDCLADTADGWNEVALPLDAAALGTVKLDAAMALQTADKAGGSTLFVRGRGRHRLELQLFFPVQESPAGSSIVFQSPGAAAAAFILDLPERFSVRSALPVVSAPSPTAGSRQHTFSLPSQAGTFTLTWRARDISPLDGGAVMLTCSYLYHVDPVRITSDLGMVLRSSLARVPAEVEMTLPPESRVLSVDGPDVLDWTMTANVAKVRFSSSDLRETNLRVVLESAAANPDANPAAVQKASLPFPSVAGVHRASGAFAIVASPEVKVRQVITSGLTAQTVAGLPGDAAVQQGFVAGFQFPVLPAPPEIEFQRLQPRFQAELHTQIDLRREAVQLHRQLRILTREGEMFSTRIRIPNGEEMVRVTLANGTEPRWQLRDSVLEVQWPESVKPAAAVQTGVLNIETRVEPADWFTFGERPKDLHFADAAVEGAELTTGYVGLDFDERFQVRAAKATGMEPTDAKRLASIGIPVRGTLTWSRGDACSLDVAVSRHPAEVHGTVTAFALPLLHTCELEGELALDVRNSGIRSLRVGAPAGVAEFLRFDSPLISERRLEKLTGEWSLTFHEELRGTPRLRFHMSLPLVRPEAAKDAPAGEDQRFQANLPLLTLPGAGRVSGQWIIEANTDTELAIAADGLDERDILTVAGITGYVPRHRIVGAYAWRGTAWKLALEGVRHAPAPLPGMVIDNLAIASVLSPDGQERREVVIELRSNGEQFFQFALPQGARMLSLTVDGTPLKPVANSLDQAGENGLRIQLPATIEAQPSRIRIVCEFADSAWGSNGRLTLVPPPIDPKIPVLKSRWRLHLPDGFSYRGFEGALEKEFEIETRSLGREVATHLGGGVKQIADSLVRKTVARSAGSPPASAAPLAEAEYRAAGRTELSKSKESFKSTHTQSDAKSPAQEAETVATSEMPAEPPGALQPELRQLLLEAANFYDLGQFNEAAARFRRALETEPDNAAVRRFLERTEKEKSAAGEAARDQTRAKMLAEVEALWETKEATAMDAKGDQNLPALPGKSATLTPAEDRQKSVLFKSGLLPLELELPSSGRSYSFAGNHLPSPISLRYASWEREVKIAWVWILCGGLLAVLWARRRPIFCGGLFALVLHFAPQIGGSELAAPCNGLLLGWLSAVVFFLAVRLARRFARWRTPVTASLLFVAAAAAAFIAAPSDAAEAAPKAGPSFDVFVPFDASKPLADQAPGRYFLDYDAFQRLWKQAKENRQAAAAPGDSAHQGAPWAKLQGGFYQARAEGTRLLVDGLLTIHSEGAWARAPLSFAGASLSSLLLDGAAAPLQGGELLLEKAGVHRVEVKLELPLETGWQQASFGIPTAPASMLALTLTDMTSRLRINGGVPTVETASAEGVAHRTITAAAGTAPRLVIERVLSATMTNQAEKLPPTAQVRSSLFLSPALERLETTIEYQFPGGDRREFALDFDAALTPLTFEIPNLESWNLKLDGKKKLLEFRLALPVRDRLLLSLTAERPGGAVPGREEFPEVGPMAARVERSYLLLAVADLEVRALPAASHRQTEFPNLAGGDAGFQRVACYAASGDPAPLPFELARRNSTVEMMADYLYQVGRSRLELHAVLGLKAAPGQDLLKAAAAVPPGFSVTRVDSDRLQDWWVEGTQLHIRFAGDTPPVTTLLVGLAQPWAQPPSEFSLVPIQFEGIQKVKGRAVIAALPDANVRLQLDQQRIAAREVGLGEQLEEYPAIGKYTVTEPFEAKRALTFDVPAYQAKVALEPVPPKYDVRWVLGADVQETWTRVEVRCDLEVKNGAPTSVLFELPEGLGEAKVTGDDIRETERTRDEARHTVTFRVHFQRPILRQTGFVIQFEIPHSGDIALPTLHFPDSGLQERFAIVQNSSEGELRTDAAGTSHAEPLAARDVAKAVHFVLRNLTRPQYFRLTDGWNLKFKLEKLASTGGAKALALHAELLTAVRATGETWLRAAYRLQNRALQFLPVRLPDGFELISASVSGQQLRADLGWRDGVQVFLVPLIQTKAGDLALDVDLVCRKAAPAGGLGDAWKLVLDDPELPGVTVERTVWKVSLPPGFELKDSGGNMEKVEAAAAEQEIVTAMLDEARSLLSLASSKDNSIKVRTKARRNAQNVVSSVTPAQAAGREVLQELEDIVRQIQQAETEAKPDPAAPAESTSAKSETWTWEANSDYVKQRQSQNAADAKKEEQLLAGNLGLNDNVLVGNGVLWGKYNAATPPSDPRAAKPDALSETGRKQKFNDRNEAVNRFQQADALDKKVVVDQLKNVEMQRQTQQSGGTESAAQQQASMDNAPTQQAAQQEVSQLDFSQNYQNAWSRRSRFGSAQEGKAEPQQQGIPALPPTRKPPAADAKPPSNAPDAIPSSEPRLRPAGRVSLAVEVAAGAGLLHFKKVKDHAALEISATRTGERRERIGAAVGLGASLALILLIDRIRSVRRQRRLERAAANS